MIDLDDLRALSFSQPWLWSILYAGKRIENRSWAPPIDMIGKRFCLHAAKSWDDDAPGFFLRLGITEFPARRDLYPTSCIMGVATIDRVVTVDKTLPADQKRWFFGEYGWVLTDVTIFQTPVPAKGRQGLWRVGDELAAPIAEQLEGAPPKIVLSDVGAARFERALKNPPPPTDALINLMKKDPA